MEYFKFPDIEAPITEGTLWKVFNESEGELNEERISDFFLEATDYVIMHTSASIEPQLTLKTQYVFCREFFKRYGEDSSLMEALNKNHALCFLLSSAYAAAKTTFKDEDFVRMIDELSDKYGFRSSGALCDDSSEEELKEGYEEVIRMYKVLNGVIPDDGSPFVVLSVRWEDFRKNGSFRAAAFSNADEDTKEDVISYVVYGLRKQGFLMTIRKKNGRNVLSGYKSVDKSIVKMDEAELRKYFSLLLPAVKGLKGLNTVMEDI